MTMRTGVCAVALLLLPGAAQAGPIFNAYVSNVDLNAGLGWSSDLGPGSGSSTGPFTPTGAPVTVSASAVRDRRTIAASITQTAPYILKDQYWAAAWTGSFDIPEPGYYGLFAAAQVRANWTFDIPGLTFSETINHPIYYAALWDATAPLDIHPEIDGVGVPRTLPLQGSSTGSFKLERAFFETGNPWFSTNSFFGAATYSGDTNEAGRMEFSYQIAFSTTPIDASVFDPPSPTTPVPEPATLVMLLGPVAGLVLRRRPR